MELRGALGIASLVAACGSPAQPPVVEAVVSPVASSAAPVPSAAEPRADPAPAPRVEPRGVPGNWTLAVPERDPRKSVAMPRGTALVKVEAQQLQRLLDATKPNAPDRPALLRRVAESYVELSRSLARDGATQDAQVARALALSRYQDLENDHPTFAKMDEVFYFHALELEMAHDLMGARKTYYELIKRHPSSTYVGPAYFAFGEMFHAEADGDPSKKSLAVAAWGEAAKHPSFVQDHAKRRLAASGQP